MTIAEKKYLESMPERLRKIEQQLTELNRHFTELIKILKNENNKV